MHRFFAYNPVFGWVISLFIALFGLISLISLPIEQYPDVAPPSLTLFVNYPGADAATLDRNVTAIIEKEMNAVEHFLYMASTSRANGTATITVTFTPGTDLDIARTQVQDRLARVEPRLPSEVRQIGVTVTKSSSSFLMIIGLTSKGGDTTPAALGNYASTRVMDELRRIDGVGDIRLLGSSYAMRIWLDPEKLAGYRLTATEALNAVMEQNSQTAGGALGDQPVARETEFTASIITQNRFSTASQFRDIIVRANPDGSTIRLGDVARVELGQETYNFYATRSGQEVAGIAIELASGANALATADAVQQRMAELAQSFPADIQWDVIFDTTPFIDASVENVIYTLVEAMLLVFLVMFLFLQDWRATLIPAIVVPIALGGACIGLALAGFSINTLSLFGMVVAIGILVDDAIVVVENVERIMREEGLNARRATVKAMSQITGAVVGMTLVLVSVYIPMAFFPGSTGGIYRQFSITLAVSIFFSAVLALTLTPSLCASLLRTHDPADADKPIPSGIRGWLPRFFRWFNHRFERSTTVYTSAVGGMIKRPLRWLAVFVAVTAVTVLLFTRLPGGFLPTEDQGVLFVSYTAPPGSTMQRTSETVEKVEAFLEQQPQVSGVSTVRGFSFFGQGQSAAMSFVNLKPWDERPGAENSSDALVQRTNAYLQSVPGAVVFALAPPPIPALGNATGFTMKVQDRTGGDPAILQGYTNEIIARAQQNRTLTGLRIEGLPPAPQLFVEIDRIRARAQGLAIADVNHTLSIMFGSLYANDFVYEGNVLRVYLQAEAEQRMHPDDVLALRVRNEQGEMVPFSSFTTVRWQSGPQQLERYNGYPAMTVSGMATPGESSGTALTEMEKIADSVLPQGYTFEWTGTAFEEKQAGGQVGLLLGLSMLVVFLLLAALYESWAIPVSVLLVVPFGILGAVVFTMLRGFSADVYFNVGLITVIGLAAKNAILIVEFAVDQEKEKPLWEATVEAARLRLRPIIMTSLAFISGMLPLVFSTGAGAASRKAVGTGVAGGMLVATVVGILFIPVFYVAARRWLARDNNYAAEDAAEEAAEAAAAARKAETHAG
ncbi:MAG: multidrug efflux RND transporter permease subunit [Sphingomonadaceae bacterium]